MLPQEGGKEAGVSALPFLDLTHGTGSSCGEMSSEKWLYSCCFCLGLKIAFYLPMSSSGPGRAVKRTQGGGESRERQKVGKTQVPQNGHRPGRREQEEHCLQSCVLALVFSVPQKLPQGGQRIPCACASGDKTRHGNATEADQR